MKVNKQKAVNIATEVVNTMIKNSEVVQPHVKPKHYQRGLIALNLIHWGLRLWERREQTKAD